MKKAINTIVWLIFLIGVFVLFSFAGKEKNTMRCSGLEIKIDRSDNNYFILEEDIKELFFNIGYRVDSQFIGEVNIKKVERLVNNNPSTLKADVFKTIDGKVKIEIKQRKPVLRVFNENGESFYLDENGWLMPLSTKFTSRVLVANGNIKDTFSQRYKRQLKVLPPTGGEDLGGADILRDLFVLTKFINENEFWKAQITQLYVNENRDIEMIPRVGSQTIILGNISDLQEKFDNLMLFYKRAMNKVGWNKYSQINLKYKNQIVLN